MPKANPTDHLSEDQKWDQIEAGIRGAITKPRYAGRLVIDLFRALRSLLKKSGVSMSGDGSAERIAKLEKVTASQGLLIAELISKVYSSEKPVSEPESEPETESSGKPDIAPEKEGELPLAKSETDSSKPDVVSEKEEEPEVVESKPAESKPASNKPAVK